jgi:hypothetical protein
VKRFLAASVACAVLVGWAAYCIASLADSPAVNRLVLVIVVASMLSGGFAVISGSRDAHADAMRRFRR